MTLNDLKRRRNGRLLSAFPTSCYNFHITWNRNEWFTDGLQNLQLHPIDASLHYLMKFKNKNNTKQQTASLQCVLSNQLFITFAECRLIFIFSYCYSEILLAVSCWEQIFYIRTFLKIKFLSSEVNIFNFDNHDISTADITKQ